MRMRALSSAPAAVRMRLHRKRRREGTHYVRIPLESFEIEGLIRLKSYPRRTGRMLMHSRPRCLPSSTKHWTGRGNSPSREGVAPPGGNALRPHSFRELRD